MASQVESIASGYMKGRLPVVFLKNRMSALVVDGDYTSRTIERSFLHYFGVDAVGVKSGREAVDLFANGERFNLIFIDKFLLEMDGLETTRRIRAMDSSCKILAVSGATFEDYGRQFLEAGADEFVEKPIWPEQLVNILVDLDNLLG